MQYLKSVTDFAIPSYLAGLIPQAWTAIATGTFGWLELFEKSAEFGVAFTIVTIPAAISEATVLSAFFPQANYLHERKQTGELIIQIRDTMTEHE